MEILCAGCIRQVTNSRENFGDVFYFCQLDSDMDVKDKIIDPIINCTDKVSNVIKTDQCGDFKDKEDIEEKAVAQEIELDS